jgi:hypothetical protein
VALPGPAWTGQAGSGRRPRRHLRRLLAAGQRPGRGRAARGVRAGVHRDPAPGPIPPQQLAEHLPGTIAELQRRARAVDDEIARSGW